MGRRLVDPSTLSAPLVDSFSLPAYDSHLGPARVDPATIRSNKILIEEPAILVSRLNPHIPRVLSGFPRDVPAVASTEFSVLLPREVNPGYLLAFLSSPGFRRDMRALVTGTSTSHQRVRGDSLLDIRMPLADERSQAAIGDLVQAVEQRQRIERVATARSRRLLAALFRASFPGVFEPRAPLGDYVNVTPGVSYKSSDFGGHDQALVTLKNIARDGTYRPEGLKAWAGVAKPGQVVVPGEVVVAHTDLTQAGDIIGRAIPVRASANFARLVASMDLSVVRPREPLTPAFLVGLMEQPEYLAHCRARASGTTVLHLGRRAVEEFRMTVPEARYILEFTAAAKDLLALRAASELECSALGRVAAASVVAQFGS